MKNRTQTASAFAGALFCATAWFAVWLTAFQPLPDRQAETADLPALALRPAGAETAVSRPTLFALPAEQGFSGTFPEPRVDMPFEHNHPRQPEVYLPRGAEAMPARPETRFTDPVSLPQAGELAFPDSSREPSAQPPGTYLFFSPELQSRTNETVRLTLSGEQPLSVRVQLQVEANGTVSRCFSETPVKSTLTASLRNLRFNPAREAMDGWIEIRFIPEGSIE